MNFIAIFLIGLIPVLPESWMQSIAAVIAAAIFFHNLNGAVAALGRNQQKIYKLLVQVRTEAGVDNDNK
jgi:hypothetical protein